MTTPVTRHCSHRDNLDEAGLADKGCLQKAWDLIGKYWDSLMNAMNLELVA